MLQENLQNTGFVEEAPTNPIDLDKVISAVRRQWKVVVATGAVGLVLGAMYAFTAPPQYTASTSLLIDPNNRQIVDQLSAVNGVMDDEPSVLSQVEILSSQKIALAVVDKLNLVNDPAFQSSNRSYLSVVASTVKSIVDVRSWFRSDELQADKDIARENAANALLKKLDTQRVGRTYVLSIDYSSESPELAAKIANAVADSYLTDQLDSKYEATRRASEWLQQRIAELRQKSLDTDLAVQKFKKDNELISTGGQLISDQQLSQLNAQLIVAQADTSKAKAGLDQIQNAIKSGQIDASVTEALNSSVISGLQEKYLEAARKEADIENRLGADHQSAVRARSDMQEYKRSMFTELGRIAETYESTYKRALANQTALEAQVEQAKGVSSTANDAQVQLRELVREADTYKTLYETFLQRYQEATQQQSFPITEARVISKATVPQKPSKPKKILVFAISLFAGLVAGAGIGGFREYRDRYFRTGEQVRQSLDLEFLGQVPMEPDSLYSPTSSDEQDGRNENPRFVRPLKSVFNYSVDNPLSSFAETLRSVRIASDIISEAEKGRVIGVVSALPGEGKSTIAINFAQLLAHQGARTVLVDGDLRAAGATRAIAAHADKGLLEVLTAGLPAKEALLMDPKTRLAFLPAVVRRRMPYSSELLASEQMGQLLDNLRRNFDYVIIDLPPMGAVVDARAIAPRLDCNVLVSEWGRTPRSTVRRALEDNQTIANKCLGVILNKVDMNRIGLYAEVGNDYYYNSRYNSYYREG